MKIVSAILAAVLVALLAGFAQAQPEWSATGTPQIATARPDTLTFADSAVFIGPNGKITKRYLVGVLAEAASSFRYQAKGTGFSFANETPADSVGASLPWKAEVWGNVDTLFTFPTVGDTVRVYPVYE